MKMVKAVILAGGLGSRLSEETTVRPKPMVEIGSRPILWHIMKVLSAQGINDFVICLGYKGYVIKEFFSNYSLHMSDVTFSFGEGRTIIHRQQTEPWSVTLVETGELSQTGGRLKRVREYVGDEPFLFTYGDGLADIDVHKLMGHHRKSGRLVTVTAVQPPGRYGALEREGDLVRSFMEKPEGDGAWINGGFFVVNPEALDAIDGDATSWESVVLPRLADRGELSAYEHRGFWMAMDTLRDKVRLEEQWLSGDAPWKIWE